MKNKSSTKFLSLKSNERLFHEVNSNFKPKKLNNYNPKGLKIYTFKSGFKKINYDLLVIIFEEISNVKCLYSQTSTPSAPIIWDKKNNKGKVKALIVNAGNANAHTGLQGLKIIDTYVNYLANLIKCKKSEILVSSTGVIGELFNPKLITSKLDKLKITKPSDLISAAKAIITTDTYVKTAITTIKISKKLFKIYGIAKGSGMIMPDMATMLVYIFIEAKISKNLLNNLVKKNVEYTFNSISVDSDTSTSDTIMVFSLNNNIHIKNSHDFKKLSTGINKIMHELSLQVIKDGEGMSKLIKVNIINAKNEVQAKKIGMSIANSPLVKTAISGEDANWGRIIMAIGKSKEKIIQNKIKIYFGNNLVCENGSIYSNINTKKLDKYMKNLTIDIKVDLGIGNYSRIIYGNDLTYDYVRINGDYRS